MKILLTIVFSLLIMVNASLAQQNEIVLATTTSIENSGLLRHILPLFEKKTGIKVKVVARGTGAALEMGKRGDADVIFVHAKELEIEAVRQGYFLNRHDVCYNDFVILGPKNDPAKILEVKKAVDAFKKIAISQSFFISRGDKSGTHMKELKIWQIAGINPDGQKWYLETGQGMEKTLRIANEKEAYTLTDRGTWLAIKDKLDLAILFQGDPVLFNQYSVLAVNPQRSKHVKYKESMEFINWIISKEGQNAIASFRDKFGNQLFIPNAR